MRFLNQDMLYFLLSIPFLVIVFFAGGKLIQSRLAKLGGAQIIEMIERSVSGRRRRLRLILLLLGLSLMIFALARPQYGSELIKVKSTGTEVIVALDASLSMLAGDFYPNRLDKAKRQIITLVENLLGESIGLIAFSGQAFVQCPLTVDHGALRMFLDVTNVGIISDTGTNLEKAIEKAAESFSPESQADKVLVIFTDGETHVGDPLSAAEKYKDQFRIFTVGVGTGQGEPIPVRGSGGSIEGYKKDENGETVISKLNEQLLQEIASVSGGSSYRSTPGEQELTSIIQKIKRMEKGETEGNFRRLYDEKFQYFLIPGIIFFGIALFVSERRNNV
ncbi:MAG: VWA domain-containing protein [candidate division Zixibacteria bacterium]|nr:VWA domain-containing protein [candidate division Zixibacteria bacterium]